MKASHHEYAFGVFSLKKKLKDFQNVTYRMAAFYHGPNVLSIWVKNTFVKQNEAQESE